MKQSVLEKLRDYQKEIQGPDFNSHFLVGIDMNEEGIPNASMMISKGRPFETIGMIDVLIKNLKDTRSQIVKELSQKEKVKEKDYISSKREKIDKMIELLPDHVKQKIRDIKKKLDDAMENRDEEALLAARQELLDLRLLSDDLDFFKNKENDDDDDSDFDISKFKDNAS